MMVIVRVLIKLLGPILILTCCTLISLVFYSYWTAILPRLPLATLQGLFLLYILICILYYYTLAVMMDPGIPHMDQEVQAAFCSYCQLYKTQRSHHCSICNKCIRKMDHHCPWINNCVGERNHPSFYLFLVYLSIGCLYFTIVGFDLFYGVFFKGLDEDIPKFLFFFSYMIASVIGLAVMALMGWQTYLIASAQTSIEYLQNQDATALGMVTGERFFNPHDKGTRGNFMHFFGITSFWSLLLPAKRC